MSAEQGVAIIGGGAVAMAYALQMRAYGFAPFLLTTPRHDGGRHYALSERRLHFLRRLGVDVAGAPVTRFNLYADGRHFPIERDRPLCHIVAEAELLDALQDRVDACQIPRYDDADSFQIRHDDDAVHLSAASARLTAAALAIADGARSRRAAEMGCVAQTSDFSQYATVATVRAPDLEPAAAYQWFGDYETIALLPIYPQPPQGGQRYALIWARPADVTRTVATAPDDLLARLREKTQTAALSWDGAPPQRDFPLFAGRRPVVVYPRAVFLGDAARTVHPMAGQGLNLGLADAFCLAQCQRYRRDPGCAAALNLYAQNRSRRGDAVDALTRFLLPSEKRTARLLRLTRLPFARRGAALFAA